MQTDSVKISPDALRFRRYLLNKYPFDSSDIGGSNFPWELVSLARIQIKEPGMEDLFESILALDAICAKLSEYHKDERDLFYLLERNKENILSGEYDEFFITKGKLMDSKLSYIESIKQETIIKGRIALFDLLEKLKHKVEIVD